MIQGGTAPGGTEFAVNVLLLEHPGGVADITHLGVVLTGDFEGC
jgi:hypothetical protein